MMANTIINTWQWLSYSHNVYSDVVSCIQLQIITLMCDFDNMYITDACEYKYVMSVAVDKILLHSTIHMISFKENSE